MAPKAIAAEVIVVGAGPAGSAAAIGLARAGTSVTLIDKAQFPRPKCCGDGLTSGCLRQLEELGLEPDLLPSWKVINEINLVSPGGRWTSFDLPRGAGQYAASARRSELDAALVSLARRSGATVLEDCAITGVTQTPGQVSVSTTGGGSPDAPLVGRWLIAADGMWSPTRKLLGHQMDGYRGDWHAFRQYFTNVSERARTELVCWFEPDLLPGYFWSFPMGDGTANVGFGVLRGGSVSTKQMKGLWPDLLARPAIADFLGPDATPEDRHTAWPIPANLGRFPLTDGRVIFVGDAAAASDPMSGEGIGQALETGSLAAESILARGGIDTGPRGVTDFYETSLSRGMKRDHALARSLGRILARPSSASIALRIVGSTGWTRRNFARWLFEDYPRAVLGTPRRWAMNTFGRPGAFR